MTKEEAIKRYLRLTDRGLDPTSPEWKKWVNTLPPDQQRIEWLKWSAEVSTIARKKSGYYVGREWIKYTFKRLKNNGVLNDELKKLRSKIEDEGCHLKSPYEFAIFNNYQGVADSIVDIYNAVNHYYQVLAHTYYMICFYNALHFIHEMERSVALDNACIRLDDLSLKMPTDYTDTIRDIFELERKEASNNSVWESLINCTTRLIELDLLMCIFDATFTGSTDGADALMRYRRDSISVQIARLNKIIENAPKYNEPISIIDLSKLIPKGENIRRTIEAVNRAAESLTKEETDIPFRQFLYILEGR